MPIASTELLQPQSLWWRNTSITSCNCNHPLQELSFTCKVLPTISSVPAMYLQVKAELTYTYAITWTHSEHTIIPGSINHKSTFHRNTSNLPPDLPPEHHTPEDYSLNITRGPQLNSIFQSSMMRHNEPRYNVTVKNTSNKNEQWTLTSHSASFCQVVIQ